MIRAAEEIKKDVVDSLYWDSRVDASDVLVDVSGNDVTLSGTVPNYSAFWAAEDDAQVVNGVVSVENRINVHPPPTITIPSDEDIRAYVLTVFRVNPVIDADRIDVTVNNGIVTLEGAVDTYWRWLRAEQLASEIIGVIAVKNELSIVPTGDVLDETIADEIRAALRRNSLIDANAITIKVKNGIVTLSGTVPHWYALRDAREAAYNTPGVIDVNDTLTITSV